MAVARGSRRNSPAGLSCSGMKGRCVSLFLAVHLRAVASPPFAAPNVPEYPTLYPGSYPGLWLSAFTRRWLSTTRIEMARYRLLASVLLLVICVPLWVLQASGNEQCELIIAPLRL